MKSLPRSQIPIAWVIILLLCIILITSNVHDISQCSPQIFNENVKVLLTKSSTSAIDVEQPFDKTRQIAQSLIDDGLPLTKKNKTSFDVNRWSLRTNGGLHNSDRIKLAQIYSQADSVFEYGLGESTFIANQVNVRRYAGVDSDAVWVAKARDKVSDTYRFYFADIGPTREWGFPKDMKHIPTKSIYQYQIMPLSAEKEAFDVYMIDGRWRIPCMVASFLHASARGANPQHTIALLHDCFRSEHWMNGTEPIPKHVNVRSSYQVIDNLLDLVDHSGDRLCVYKRKPETTDEELLQFWEENYNMIE
jgi:hypothetical protein